MKDANQLWQENQKRINERRKQEAANLRIVYRDDLGNKYWTFEGTEGMLKVYGWVVKC
jgi:hypothetical protein